MKKPQFTEKEVWEMIQEPYPFTEKELVDRFSVSWDRDEVFEKHLAYVRKLPPRKLSLRQTLAIIITAILTLLIYLKS